MYASVRAAVDPALPADVAALTADQRRAIAHSFERGGAWPGDGDALYAALVDRVAAESARRWRAAIGAKAEPMLWRLLRIGSAPYFVLGASSKGFMRFRIATPWDWRRHFELRSFEVEARPGGQPMVAWNAVVRRRDDGSETSVGGHVEVRWSHGRFCGPPEAKVYLDTPHTDGAGLLPARGVASHAGDTAAHAATSAGSDASTRARNSSSRARSPSSIQCSSASNTNDTSVSAAQRPRTACRCVRRDHQLVGVRDHKLTKRVGVRREARLARRVPQQQRDTGRVFTRDREQRAHGRRARLVRSSRRVSSASRSRTPSSTAT